MSIKSRWKFGTAVGVIILIAASTVQTSAGPSHQNPTRTPTDEPTKAPYVFPTPIFIPTYTSATDLPSTRTPVTPRPVSTITGEQTYTVESGDNPRSSQKYGDAGKYRLIVEANNLTDSTRLRIGTVLIIPPLTPAATTPVHLGSQLLRLRRRPPQRNHLLPSQARWQVLPYKNSQPVRQT
jgi:hypothetical protein